MRNDFRGPYVFLNEIRNRRLATGDWRLMKNSVLKLISLYQRFLSPLLGPACRYTPTCSHYAAEAIELHGARGVVLAVWRLLRCHPFSRGGFDPVPLPSVAPASRRSCCPQGLKPEARSPKPS